MEGAALLHNPKQTGKGNNVLRSKGSKFQSQAVAVREQEYCLAAGCTGKAGKQGALGPGLATARLHFTVTVKAIVPRGFSFFTSGRPNKIALCYLVRIC